MKHGAIDISYFLNLFLTGLWFLTTLFALSAIGAIAHTLAKGISRYVVWAIVWVLLCLCPSVWVFNQMEYLLPFFVLGIIGQKFEWEKIDWKVALAALVAYIVCFHFYSFDKSLYMMGNEFFTTNHIKSTGLRLASGISGSLLAIYITQLIMKIAPTNVLSLLTKLGTLTLPIYVLHQKFLLPNKFFGLQTENTIIYIALTIILTFITIGTYRLLRRSRWIAYFMFGEKINFSKIENGKEN